MTKSNVRAFPRSVRPVQEPLGLYIRSGHNDQKLLLDVFSRAGVGCNGVVFDPRNIDSQGELIAHLEQKKVDRVLDTKALHLSLPGGYNDKLGQLPWGGGRIHTIDDYKGLQARKMALSIADYAVDKGFSQVIAPCHYLRSADDPWLKADVEMVDLIRQRLHQLNAGNIQINYPLVIPYKLFRDQNERRKIISWLGKVAIDAIWLRVDGVKRDGGPQMAINYIEGAKDFHHIAPVVGDHVGGLMGHSLLSFGAIGGISHGITQGERFDAKSLMNISNGKGFKPPRTVYIKEIDLFLKRVEAEEFFEKAGRAKALFICKNTGCCPRGQRDMLEDPGKHFLLTRMSEVQYLSGIPEIIRPQRFLEMFLRKSSDMAVRASNIEGVNPILAKKVQSNRLRLDKVRSSLSGYLERSSSLSFSKHPKTLAARTGAKG